MFDRFGLLEPYRSQSEIMKINNNSIWLGDYSAALDIISLKVINKIDYNSALIIQKVYCQLFILWMLNIQISIIKSFIQKINQILIYSNILIFIIRFIISSLFNGNKSFTCHCYSIYNKKEIHQRTLYSISIYFYQEYKIKMKVHQICYIMKKYKYPFSKAYHIVRKKRPIICPNFGFSFQLKQYERICIQPKIMPEVVYKEFKCPPIQQVRSISLRKSPQQQFINCQAQSERQQCNTNSSLSASSERKTIHQKRKQKDKKLPKLQPQINFVSYNTIKEFAQKLKASRLNQIQYD